MSLASRRRQVFQYKTTIPMCGHGPASIVVNHGDISVFSVSTR